MVIEAHIGLLNCPGFDFYGGDYNGNIPKRLSPYLPLPREIHRRIWSLIRSGEDSARQLDWSAVGLICSKQQLIDFTDSLEYSKLTHMKESVDKAIAFIQGLDADTRYVLVAYETGEDYEE